MGITDRNGHHSAGARLETDGEVPPIHRTPASRRDQHLAPKLLAQMDSVAGGVLAAAMLAGAGSARSGSATATANRWRRTSFVRIA